MENEKNYTIEDIITAIRKLDKHKIEHYITDYKEMFYSPESITYKIFGEFCEIIRARKNVK